MCESSNILLLMVQGAQGQEAEGPWTGRGQALSDHTHGKRVTSLGRADLCSGDGRKGWQLEGVKWHLKGTSVHPQDIGSFLTALGKGDFFSMPSQEA